MLAVAQVGPAHGGNFKLRLLPTVVAGGRPINGSVRNFVGGKGAGGGERKGGLEEDVRLVPVDLVVDVHLIAFSREAKCLDELRILPVAGYTNAGLGGLEQLNRISMVHCRGRNVESTWIDIPCVVLLWRVFEELELIAAGAGSESLKF